MKINKTLKTFPDGSKFTVAMAAVAVPASLVLGGISAYVTVRVENWREERWLKKRGLHQDQLNSKKS